MYFTSEKTGRRRGSRQRQRCLESYVFRSGAQCATLASLLFMLFLVVLMDRSLFLGART